MKKLLLIVLIGISFADYEITYYFGKEYNMTWKTKTEFIYIGGFRPQHSVEFIDLKTNKKVFLNDNYVIKEL